MKSWWIIPISVDELIQSYIKKNILKKNVKKRRQTSIKNHMNHPEFHQIIRRLYDATVIRSKPM